MTEHHTPKPPSASSMLKLLKAAGAGARFELQPEHISALEAGIAALAFQHEVRQLVHQGQKPHHPQTSPPRSLQDPRLDSRSASLHTSRSTRLDRTPHPPKPPAPARPTEGSGAIWTDQEESHLRAQWERDDAIGAISEAHKRSPLACLARLIRIGALASSPATDAAIFLIKKQQLVRLSNASDWETRAASFGFEPHGTLPPHVKNPSV